MASEEQDRDGVTVNERISDQTAAAAQLLDTSPAQADVTDTDLGVGQAPADVTGYWFGRSAGGWHVAAAAEHSRVRTAAQVSAGTTTRGEIRAYVAFYEPAGKSTTSAQPGTGAPRPDGELQVTSEAIGTAHAQGLIASFNGTNGDASYPAWPRFNVTLPDGEAAVVVPDQSEGTGSVRNGFYVMTPSTLVSVSGGITVDSIQSLAATLRPLK